MAFVFPLRVSGEVGLSRVSAGVASRPPSASQDQMCLGLRGKKTWKHKTHQIAQLLFSMFSIRAK